MTDTLWEQRGLFLAREHRLQQFQIADWLLQGIEQHGATSAYDYAETVFPQYTRATFQSWVTVAKHFPSSIRIESDFLTFGHYQVAQGAESVYSSLVDCSDDLLIAGELVWLRKADEGKLSVSALRAAIKDAHDFRRNAYLEDHPELKPAPPEADNELTKTKVLREERLVSAGFAFWIEVEWSVLMLAVRKPIDYGKARQRKYDAAEARKWMPHG